MSPLYESGEQEILLFLLELQQSLARMVSSQKVGGNLEISGDLPLRE